MEQKLLEALKSQYVARLSKAEANLLNYFKNSAGIGEHPDVVGEMVKMIDEISQARGSLDTIASMTSTPATNDQSDPPA